MMPVLQPIVTTTAAILAAASNTFNLASNTCTISTNATAPVTPSPSANNQKPQEPLFISVPPRPQRVLHSEAYIKYIEGLQADNKYVTSWEKTLNATQDNAPNPDPEKLSTVTTWLGKKYNQQEDVINALWELRNQLLRDSLGLSKNY